MHDQAEPPLFFNSQLSADQSLPCRTPYGDPNPCFDVLGLALIHVNLASCHTIQVRLKRHPSSTSLSRPLPIHRTLSVFARGTTF